MNIFVKSIVNLHLGKYLSNIDSVMTMVDRITEDLDHMPVAAFILTERQSDMLAYSTDER